jgi:hypothetical protein
MPPNGSLRDVVTALLDAPGKRRTIRRYLTMLPGRLRQDYGHRGPFTPQQVRATIARHRISSERQLAYAIALFCDAEALIRFRRETGGDRGDGPDPRREIAERFFQGDGAFTLDDVYRDFGGHDASAGFGADGGGHHGGSDHGGGGHGPL